MCVVLIGFCVIGFFFSFVKMKTKSRILIKITSAILKTAYSLAFLGYPIRYLIENLLQFFVTFCLETQDLIDSKRRALISVDVTMYIFAAVIVFVVFFLLIGLIIKVLINFRKTRKSSMLYSLKADLKKSKLKIISFYFSFLII